MKALRLEYGELDATHDEALDVVDVEAFVQPVHQERLGGLALDPYYEAKCVPYLRPGDLFWVVGRRGE